MHLQMQFCLIDLRHDKIETIRPEHCDGIPVRHIIVGMEWEGCVRVLSVLLRCSGIRANHIAAFDLFFNTAFKLQASVYDGGTG